MAEPQLEQKSAKHPLRSMGEMVVIVAAAIFFAITIQAFAVKPYRIPSPSMMPTLEPGQRILVDRFSHLLGERPRRSATSPSSRLPRAPRPCRASAASSPGSELQRTRQPPPRALTRPRTRRARPSSSAWWARPATRSPSATATSSATASPRASPLPPPAAARRATSVPSPSRRAPTSSWATTAATPTTAASGARSRAPGSSARRSSAPGRRRTSAVLLSDRGGRRERGSCG